jgi:hypothetical protein
MNAPTERLRLRPLPRPGLPNKDRRQRRTNDAATALELALSSAARRGELAAVLVVDEQGMLVAKSNTDLDLTMLAAVTPIVGRGKAIPRVRRGGEPLDMSVDVLELLGEVLYVAALGGTHRDRVREVAGSMAAARRIMA